MLRSWFHVPAAVILSRAPSSFSWLICASEPLQGWICSLLLHLAHLASHQMCQSQTQLFRHWQQLTARQLPGGYSCPWNQEKKNLTNGGMVKQGAAKTNFVHSPWPCPVQPYRPESQGCVSTTSKMVMCIITTLALLFTIFMVVWAGMAFMPWEACKDGMLMFKFSMHSLAWAFMAFMAFMTFMVFIDFTDFLAASKISEIPTPRRSKSQIGSTRLGTGGSVGNLGGHLHPKTTK